MTAETEDVLLVEDDPQDVQLILRMLQGEKAQRGIAVAGDGEEALDFLLCRGAFSRRAPTDAPRLVLLDLKLPKVDGFGVLKEIKTNPASRRIPVVVLTSSGEQSDIVESYRLGANGYVRKPVEMNEFRQTMRALVLYWLTANLTPSG